MAKEQKAKVKIEDLPRPEKELSAEQAEKITGGAFSKLTDDEIRTWNGRTITDAHADATSKESGGTDVRDDINYD